LTSSLSHPRERAFERSSALQSAALLAGFLFSVNPRQLFRRFLSIVPHHVVLMALAGLAIQIEEPPLGGRPDSSYSKTIVPAPGLRFGAVHIMAKRQKGLRRAPSRHQPALDANQTFQEAVTRYRQGSLTEAERLYKNVLRRSPGHLGASLALALLCANRGEIEDGVQLVRQALGRAPNSPQAQCCLGELLRAAHRYDEAVTHYEAALALQPNFAEAHNDLAIALQALHREAEAVTHYEAALALKPDFAEAHDNFGTSLQAAGRLDEAIAHHQLALILKPGYLAAHNNLGNALRALGRQGEAIAQYEAALSIGPDSAEAHNNMGTALQGLGRLDAAREHYDAALTVRPDYAEAHYNLANVLQMLDRPTEAIANYQAALTIRPDYSEAHNNLGTVLLERHRYAEAAARYQVAVALKPNNMAAHNNLGIALQELDRLDEALVHHQTALRLEPDNSQVHQSLAILFFKQGQVEAARRHGRLGFGNGIELPPRHPDGRQAPVLVLTSALGGMVRFEDTLDDQTFWRATVTAEFCDPNVELPPHRLVVNSIGDADRGGPALAAAEALLARTSAPVINPPARVLATARVANARRLGRLPGVATPKVSQWRRETLRQPGAAAALLDAGFSWPLLLRSPGFHTGEHFLKLARPDELPTAVAALPGDELLVMEYADVHGDDGKVRKYRVMMVDGQLHPLHLAISSRWMVHFMTADMAEHPDHRAEDARFLDDMPGVLGPRVMAALACIQETLGLDYGGIDFSIDAQGRVVVFEANATMVAPLPEDDERWAYRRPAVERVHNAVRHMLLARASALADSCEKDECC